MTCKKCGKEFDDEFDFCPKCGFKVKGSNILKTENQLSNIVKVLIVVGICIIPFVGWIGGIIAGIIFMNNSESDSKSFGKAILILSIITVIWSMLCCVILAAFNVRIFNTIDRIENIPYEYYYEFEEFI